MSALTTKGPDLGDIAERINAEHDAAVRSFGSALDHARNAGQLLIDAKAALPHGAWLPWIENNCKFGERSGRTYMRIAREWPRLESNRQSVADLSIAKAVEIIAPKKAAPTSTPATQPKPATAITVESREITDDPPASPPEREPSALPGPTSTMGQAFASRLRRDPTPEETAENEMRERLSRVVVKHVQDWHRENRNATTELICGALRDVVIRLQDGEVELDGGGA